MSQHGAASLPIAFIFVLIAETHTGHLLPKALHSPSPILSRGNRTLKQTVSVPLTNLGVSCRNQKRDAIFDCLIAVDASCGGDSLSRRKRFDKWQTVSGHILIGGTNFASTSLQREWSELSEGFGKVA